jgi:hypothetical protein
MGSSWARARVIGLGRPPFPTPLPVSQLPTHLPSCRLALPTSRSVLRRLVRCLANRNRTLVQEKLGQKLNMYRKILSLNTNISI